MIKNPLQAIEHGIGFITEDRKTEGLCWRRALRKCIPDQSGAYFRQGQGGNQQGEGKRAGQKAIEELHIRCFGPGHECVNLSGGNQQKVVFKMDLHTEPRILILDEP